jgi:hypothetical protein
MKIGKIEKDIPRPISVIQEILSLVEQLAPNESVFIEADNKEIANIRLALYRKSGYTTRTEEAGIRIWKKGEHDETKSTRIGRSTN